MRDNEFLDPGTPIKKSWLHRRRNLQCDQKLFKPLYRLFKLPTQVRLRSVGHPGNVIGADGGAPPNAGHHEHTITQLTLAAEASRLHCTGMSGIRTKIIISDPGKPQDDLKTISEV